MELFLSAAVDNHDGMCYSRVRQRCPLRQGGIDMIAAFRVTWQGFKDLWEQIVLLVMLK